MAAPPGSPTRPALFNTTNTRPEDAPLFLTQPTISKRTAEDADGGDKKRVKLSGTAEEDTSSDSDSEVDLNRTWTSAWKSRRRTVFGMRDAAMAATSFTALRHTALSTGPVLQSFVSSQRSDVYKCHSVDETSYNAVPYACAYSHGAKSGRTPLLAIATEQGAVHVVNTSARRDWDCEPPRTVLTPHANGIFDIKWSPSDNLLATASGDHTVCISTLESSDDHVLHVLRGHSGTVKCVAWDPSHDGEVLCTGGRDGGICVWDLRVGERSSGTRGADGNDARDNGVLQPVISIAGAHEDGKPSKPRPRKSRPTPAAAVRSVTSIVYAGSTPHTLVSSGSYDGALRQWDLRLPTASKKTAKSKITPKPILISADPTTLGGTRRARGVTTLVPGTGPSAGQLFALGTDARVHTFALPSLAPLSGYGPPETDACAYTHPQMQTNSFYVRAALSPCGRWLANGSSVDGRVFLFDVSSAGRWASGSARAVVLRGQKGEVGALDWAQDMLATCADDATVRVWRPDVAVHRRCLEDSEEMRWQWSWAADD